MIDVRFADVSIVLPGDIGAAVEHRLAHEIDAAVRVPIRVLAAPHHGSRSSSTAMFLDALAPRAVLISAGLNNRHGHPAPATLDRYRSRGIDVFRTDLDGAIQLLTDGHAVHIVSCSGRRARIQRVPRRSGRFRQRRSASVSMPAFGRVTNGMMR